MMATMPQPSGEIETFRSHSNWIRALATLAGFGATMTTQGQALARLATRAASFPVPEGVRGQASDVFPCLHRAWGTELLLTVSKRFATEEELLRLANSWGAVQAYYAAYGATQALIVAEGRPRPASHPATQKQYVDMWVRRTASLPPWSFAAGPSDDLHADADGYINGPGRRIDPTAHSWSTCSVATCWDIAALALRSTRQRVVAERLHQKRKDKLRQRQKEWRTEEVDRIKSGKRPRREPAWPGQAKLTDADIADVRRQLRPYTLLDYLFRLRIKANYEDARMFTDGPEAADDSSRVAHDLSALTAATMLVHEVRIAKLMGPAPFLTEAEDWILHNNPPGPPAALTARLAFLRAVL
jgi:hypothetical protein